MNSENVRKSCCDVLGGQDSLKIQKSVQKMSKIAIAFYFCNIHFMQLYQFVESWSSFHQAAMVYWLA